MQRFKGVASGKQLFREHCATKWFLEANPRNISASKISRYTVYEESKNDVCTYSRDRLSKVSCVSSYNVRGGHHKSEKGVKMMGIVLLELYLLMVE